MNLLTQLLRVENIQDENQRIYSVENTTLFSSFLGHVSFLFLFWGLRVWQMAVLNIFSCLFLFASYILNRKGRHYTAFLIGIVEASVHAVAAVYFVGWEMGFQYYFLVLIPFIFYWPFSKTRTKIFSGSLMYIIFSVTYMFSRTFEPVYKIEYWKSNITTLFIVFTTFFIYAIMARIYQINVEKFENELRKANALLNDLASTDPLTDLDNRRVMKSKLGQEERRSQLLKKNFSLVMGDIDDFKHFNDTYGHEFGDVILINLARILKTSIRSEDVVSRWGGEEFLLLLPETDHILAGEIVERIRREVATTPIWLGEEEIHITMTFGVAEYCEGNHLASIIARADQAMYEGKRTGKNKVVVKSIIQSPSSEGSI